MSLLDRFRPAPPSVPADVIADVTRALTIVDQQLYQIVRRLDRPTQPTNDIEDHALRTLRRSTLSARVALRRSIR
ncbi:hypothetical protein [Micromonospora aurantiaca]|uniref:Uncharacterized protein n=1 Tax=Micromonospora aurantiaca (nom. illeg.) TaxID=47850 RepID=A0A6N3JV80_9ACTN|nr:hypothetical protein [Micromonospora aurantiaca]AXH89380.1 hypothetical protein DVH21_05205 [Micromonospora aurantiaca]